MALPYTPNAQLFHGTPVLPSDGDPANAASVNAAGFQYLADNTAFLALRTASTYNVLNFGADPTGVTDCAVVAQALINAAYAAGGGVVFFPPGSYLLNSGLSLSNSVSLIGVEGASKLILNHATANFVTAALGTFRGTPVNVISGLAFEGAVANTGHVINCDSATPSLIIRNCSSNYSASFLQGTIVRVTEATSSVLVQDCNFGVTGTVAGITASAGRVLMRGGRLTMPATYGTGLFTGSGSGTISADGALFDMRSHASGTASAVNVTSSLAKASIRNCRFDATGAGGTTNGFTWVTDAYVHETNNEWLGTITEPFGTNAAGIHSDVALRPSTAVVTASSSITVPSGYRSVILVSSTTSNPAITMPAGLFPGQVLQLLLYNAAASSIAPTMATTPVTGTTIPTINAGNTLTGTFAYMDRNGLGTYRWIQVGTWGVGLTLV